MVKVGARPIPFIGRHIAAEEREETAFIGQVSLSLVAQAICTITIRFGGNDLTVMID